jgi:hypothetical protein
VINIVLGTATMISAGNNILRLKYAGPKTFFFRKFFLSFEEMGFLVKVTRNAINGVRR